MLADSPQDLAGVDHGLAPTLLKYLDGQVPDVEQGREISEACDQLVVLHKAGDQSTHQAHEFAVVGLESKSII